MIVTCIVFFAVLTIILCACAYFTESLNRWNLFLDAAWLTAFFSVFFLVLLVLSHLFG